MDIHEELILQDCPFCRGAGLLEEEGGWCWYVMCTNCGAQTAAFEYKSPEERLEAAGSRQKGGLPVEHREGCARKSERIASSGVFADPVNTPLFSAQKTGEFHTFLDSLPGAVVDICQVKR